MNEYQCVICDRVVACDGTKLPVLYPFCSRRCQLVDLGRWFREEYTIERNLHPEDLPDAPPTDTDGR